MGNCINCCISKYSNNINKDILEKIDLDDCAELTYDFTIAKVVDVYDGDTFTIAAWYDGIIRKFDVRLFGIDCPEIKKPRGIIETPEQKEKRLTSALMSKNYIINNLLNKIIQIEILNNKTKDRDFLFKNFGEYVETNELEKYISSGKKYKEKWGRLLANVYIDNKLLSINMIKKNLGYPYFGGKKH